MFTKFVLEDFLGTILRKNKAQRYICIDEHKIKSNKVSRRKLQKNGKVMDDYNHRGHASEMKQAALAWKGETVGLRKKNDDDKNKNNNYNNNNTSSNTVRVKVLMTKEEAAKLLAKCKKEGDLEFKDVVTELAKLPPQRVTVVTQIATRTSKEVQLDSIIEEEELA